MISRRGFICGIALGTLMVPPAASAQPPRKIYRIGITANNSATADMVGPQTRSPGVNGFLQGLRELGYVYGENFVTEPRGAEGKPERFSTIAAELVRLQVDVIVAGGGMLYALKQTTSTIPVVMIGIADPVGEGFARSLANPGGNFTGFSLQGIDIARKRLELLKELVPSPAPVAVLWHRTNLPGWHAVEAAARERGWNLISLEIRRVAEIEGAFKAATVARSGAVLVFGSGLLDPHARRIAEMAAKSRLPAMYSFLSNVEVGGLISYGVDVTENLRRAAVFVDKILKGAKPADLPIEQPTKFELAVNLETAKSLGLAIPPSILLRADKIIQQSTSMRPWRDPGDVELHAPADHGLALLAPGR